MPGQEKYEQPLAGHTVTSHLNNLPDGEIIVGHVLNVENDGFINVLWLSTTRGAFTCIEYGPDLIWCQNIDPPGDYEPRYIVASIAAVPS